MIEALLGIIIGLLINPAKRVVEKQVEVLEAQKDKGHAQFIEPRDKKKEWLHAESLKEFIE